MVSFCSFFEEVRHILWCHHPVCLSRKVIYEFKVKELQSCQILTSQTCNWPFNCFVFLMPCWTINSFRTFWKDYFQAVIETCASKLEQYVPSKSSVNPCQSIHSNITDEWNLMKYRCENCKSSRMKVSDLMKSTKHICYNVPTELGRNANTKLSSFLIYTRPRISYYQFIFTSLLYVFKFKFPDHLWRL
jgi:hypothetical protein